jgi:uncharacterized protein (DUF736 family)
MADYDNNMRGVLFHNDKGDNPKRPDMTGSLEIDGTKYRVSAWSKTSQKGNDFLSFVVEEDDGSRKAAPVSNGASSQMDDAIPF